MNTPNAFEQKKKTSVKNNVKQQLDLAEILSNQQTESESNLPTILNLPEIVALKKQIEEEDKDVRDYFDWLVNEVGFDKDKLDELYKDFILKKTQEVMEKLEESGYDDEKIEYFLGEEVVEKYNQVRGKLRAIQEGALTIEEKVKQLGLSEKTTNTTKGFLKKFKGFLKIGKDSVTESVKKAIFGTQNKIKELVELKPEIEQIIKDISKSEEELVKSAKDYYKAFLALSFVEIAYNKTLESLSTKSGSNFAQARSEKQATMIKNRLTRIKSSKVLLEIASIDNFKRSEKALLIADNLENEYHDTVLYLAIILGSLKSQEKVIGGVDLTNSFQDFKNALLSGYIGYIKKFNDEITRAFESPNKTAEILTKEIKSLTQNIEKNKKRISQIDKEVENNIVQMNNAFLELKKVVKE